MYTIHYFHYRTSVTQYSTGPRWACTSNRHCVICLCMPWSSVFQSSRFEKSWPVSININGMAINLCLTLFQLAKTNNNVVLLLKTKINDPEKDRRLHYIWKTKINGAACTNPATAKRSGSNAILLTANAASIVTDTDKMTQKHVPVHGELTVSGKISGSSVPLQSMHASVKSHLRAIFSVVATIEARTLHYGWRYEAYSRPSPGQQHVHSPVVQTIIATTRMAFCYDTSIHMKAPALWDACLH